jgi:hypothetical protein
LLCDARAVGYDGILFQLLYLEQDSRLLSLLGTRAAMMSIVEKVIIPNPELIINPKYPMPVYLGNSSLQDLGIPSVLRLK